MSLNFNYYQAQGTPKEINPDSIVFLTDKSTFYITKKSYEMCLHYLIFSMLHISTNRD
ncbi:hypothetical protein NIES23_49370 [Trichormus variabilis NIES-23]|uniref:Uncharacterized protein n=1 Tax=Trichormus variabilis NIES-23 TaxID=1973479 RepID=A0A1Z4KT80_ANAVA|nr:hypothetical protein NIES23_49370 [Trichormus variabilis NIES-23]